jgi:tetratricopeptide (TPR) repeat protein
MKSRICPILPLGLATVLAVSAVSRALAQSDACGFARDVEELVELATSARTMGDAEARFLRLRRTAPADARIPYLYAILMINRKRYQEAREPLQDALRLDGKDLAAWKTRIWLSVLTEDYDDALETMNWLVRRMPQRGASAESERKCDEFVGFVGQVFGYLSEPGKEHVDAVKLTSCQQAIQSCLPDERKDVLQASCQAVIEDYQARMRQIDGLREQAREREADRRELKFKRLSQDRLYAASELGKIEDLRTGSRMLASDERNMIAATRVRVRAASVRTDDAHYTDSYAVGPVFSCSPQDHLANRGQGLAHRGAGSSGYLEEHGLGDGHYADVNRREEDYDEYLVDREKDLNRRHRRIGQDTSRLLNRPVVGNASEVLCQRKKATALSTYVPLPVSPGKEVERILASYRNP